MIKRKLAGQQERSNLRTQMCFRGISIDTSLRLKVMAINRGIPLYQLLDELVDKAWKKQQDTPASAGVSGKIRKEVRKLLKAQVWAPSPLCQ